LGRFFLEGYGWVPVDVTYKNANPYSNYFGKVRIYDNGIIVSEDLLHTVEFELDLFIDAHVVALLEWDTLADLDLLVWSDYSNEILPSTDFWYGQDYTSGLDGIESFRFSSGKNNSGQHYDFSKG
jgi:hypothetical protein